ncbi:MAG: response regulator transcription factor, partial [Phycisphaerae bacterium]
MISPTQPIRLVAADDHQVFREGLVAQINNEPDMTAVAVVGDAEAAVREAIATKPDILLMDIEMPGLDTFAAAAGLAEHQPPVRIIFLSAFTYDNYIERAVQAKAWGFVDKSEPFNTIRDAIREVYGGWIYYSSAIKARITHTPDGPRIRRSLWDGVATRGTKLTARELELLRY